MNHALKKNDKKMVKGKEGVIGFSKQKSTVAEWDLIKHRRTLHIKQLNDLCGLIVRDEY